MKGILHLMANDSYRNAQFNVAAKAFDALCKYDPSPEHIAAKRGACVGWFQMILTGKEQRLVTRYLKSYFIQNISLYL